MSRHGIGAEWASAHLTLRNDGSEPLAVGVSDLVLRGEARGLPEGLSRQPQRIRGILVQREGRLSRRVRRLVLQPDEVVRVTVFAALRPPPRVGYHIRYWHEVSLTFDGGRLRAQGRRFYYYRPRGRL